ncbi:hypothetical protein GQ54DRAFT_241636, partial [Martensiomyces pterosporus]
GTNSVTGAAFNVLNSIIGSGIIGLPYALNSAGMATGLLLLLAVGLISQFASYTLVLTGKRVGAMHYSEVAYLTLGTSGYRLLNVSMVVALVGGVVTYLIILGDIISSLRQTYLPSQEWATRSTIIMLSSYTCILPLLFFRHAGPLSRFSVVSIVALPIILLIIGVRAPIYAATSIEYPPLVGRNVFPALGVLSFSYCSAHAAFQNFLGLKHRTLHNWAQSTTLATWPAILICCSFASVGLLSFGSSVHANIFLNFPATDVYINVAQVLFCLTLVLTFPLSFYAIRDTLTHALQIHAPQRANRARVYESLVTVVVFSLLVFVATQCTDLGLAYELVGTAAASVISFVFPALIFL